MRNGQVAPAHELGGVARQGADAAQGLGQLVGDAGRQLAQHGHFAGVYQLVLGGAQGDFGLLALGHFAAQLGVGIGQLLGAQAHLVLQVGIGLLQHLFGQQFLFFDAAALAPVQHQHDEQRHRHARAHAVEQGLVAHARQADEDEHAPVHAVERAAQHQVPGLAAPFAQLGAVPGHIARDEALRLLRVVIHRQRDINREQRQAQRAVGAGQLQINPALHRQGGQRGEAPAGLR